MSMVAKILIFVNLALAVAVMGAAGAYLQSAENWRDQFNKKDSDTKATILDLQGNLKQTQGNLDEANRKAAAATAAQAASEATVRTLQTNQDLLQKSQTAMQTSLSGLEARIGDLQQNLAAARAANDNLQKEKAQADDEKRAALEAKAAAETEQKRLENAVANLTGQLDAADKNKAALAEDLEKTSTSLAIYKEKYPPIGVQAAPVKGMVLAAEPKTGIYLISVGSKNGLKVADELTISNENGFVASVVVDKVFDDKASVMVKRIGGKALKKDGTEIRQGDKVGNSY